jgi:asparagine N-glycosylation enzyme membrane subunit Stt3
LSLNLAGLVGGAVPTIVAAPLLESYGVTYVGVMLAAVVAVSLVCTALLSETKDVALQ